MLSHTPSIMDYYGKIVYYDGPTVVTIMTVKRLGYRMVPITIDPYMVTIVIHFVITINPYFERYTYSQNERVFLKCYS